MQESYEERYRSRPFENELVRYRKEMIVEQIAKYQPKSLLEIGCGLEPLFLNYQDYTSYQLVEADPAFAANARSLAKDDGRIKISEGYFEEVAETLRPQTYDFIVCSSLLHVVPDPKLLLGAIKKVMSNGSIVHFNVPNANSFHRLLAVEMGLIESPTEFSELNRRFDHHNVFTTDTFQKIVEEAGLSIVAKGGNYIKPFTHQQMQAMLDQNIIDQRVLDGLEKMTKYFPEYASEIYILAKLA